MRDFRPILIFGVIILALGFSSGCSDAKKVESNWLIDSRTYEQSVANVGAACSATTSCPANLVCDYLFAGPQNGEGTCQVPCKNAGGAGAPCTAGQICNPLTGTCQAGCNQQNNNCSDELNGNTNGVIQCSSSTTAPGYCEMTCKTTADCNSPGSDSSKNVLVCDTSRGICAPNCGGGGSCAGVASPDKQTNLSCNTSINFCYLTGCSTTCAAPNQQCSNGYCEPAACTSSAGCPASQICNLQTSQCGACSANSECNARNANWICNEGACQAPCNATSCLNGQICNLSSGLCGACNLNSQCSVGTTCESGSCSCTGATCSSGEPCVNKTCVACTDNSLCPSGQVCDVSNGTCQAKCTVSSCGNSQACNLATGLCGSCSASNACALTQTCNRFGICEELCTAGSCRSGSVCVNGACSVSNAKTDHCGNGVVETTLQEACDEGKLNTSCCVDADCGNGLICNAGEAACIGAESPTYGQCVYPSGKPQGNGLNGHCSSDCSTVCAVTVFPSDTTNPFTTAAATSPKSLHNLLSTALGVDIAPISCDGNAACPAGLTTLSEGSSCVCVTPSGICPDPQGTGSYWSTAPDVAICPCGYGVWMANGQYLDSQITVNGSLNIYGGFSGSEYSIYDRQDLVSGAKPLGSSSFSGTIINNASAEPLLQLGVGGSGSSKVTLDGFQLLNGKSSIGGAAACASDTSAPSPSGGITICKDAKATLQNLRMVKNHSDLDGGAIKNTGVMVLKESAVILNDAGSQGGGVSHMAASSLPESTIDGVVFYENSVENLRLLQPVCSAGGQGTCPFGLSCPLAGGPCIGSPTLPIPFPCNSDVQCLPGQSCLLSKCSGPFGGWPLAAGGAITSNAPGGGSTLTIRRSKFNSNHTYMNGGAIYSTSPLNVTSSIFVANSASNAGGAVYLGNVRTSFLSNLTFKDNKSYTVGGGGVYDGSSGNVTIENSLFRDNQGLYPVNASNLLEWMGNRTATVPINSINPNIVVTSTTNPVQPSFQPSVYSYLDICPANAYVYNSTSVGDSPMGVCTGTDTQLCGIPTTTGFGNNITFNSNAVSNKCNAPQEFADCAAPTYRRCQPFSGKEIPGVVVTSVSSDINGNIFKVPILGAYVPATCTSGCVPCNDDSDCSLLGKTCSNGVCS